MVQEKATKSLKPDVLEYQLMPLKKKSTIITVIVMAQRLYVAVPFFFSILPWHRIELLFNINALIGVPGEDALTNVGAKKS